MKWKHTLVFALAIFAIGGSVYAVVPLKTSAQQWSKASADAGECPAGAQPYDCMDNRAEVPTWHYQDGGSAPMPVGGVVANRIPIGNASGTGFTTNANFQYVVSDFAIQVPGLEGYTGHGLYMGGDGSDNALFFLGDTTDEHAFLQVGGNLSHVWSKDGSYQLPSSTAAACVACMRFNGTNLQFSENGSTWNNFGSGGGGGIGGSITSGQIAFGDTTSNDITGTNNATLDSSGNATFASVTTPTVTGSGTGIAMSSGVLTLEVGGGAPRYYATTSEFESAVDFAYNLGRPAARWGEAWFRRRGGVSQTISAASTITLNPALGEDIHVVLGSGAGVITTVNGAAGYPDEPLRVTIQNNASGNGTISGWATGTNGFALNSPYVPSPGASAVDVLTFAWDGTAALWRETSRVMQTPQVTRFGNATYQGTSTDLPPTTWTAATLLNSWSDVGSPFPGTSYYKDALGMVHVRIAALVGAATTNTIFTLPAGYRPEAILLMTGTDASNAIVAYKISNTGDVSTYIAGSTSLFNGEITFTAAN